MCAQLLQLCPALCDPVDCNPPGSSVHGILQARMLEWVVRGSSQFFQERVLEWVPRGSSQPREQTRVSCISCTAGGLFTAQPLGNQPSRSLTRGLSCYTTALSSQSAEDWGISWKGLWPRTLVISSFPLIQSSNKLFSVFTMNRNPENKRIF